MKEKRINHRGHRGKINSLCSPKGEIKCKMKKTVRRKALSVRSNKIKV